MIPVELSEAADADLVEILSYGTETFGEERAEAYVASFQITFDLISYHPRAGAIQTRSGHRSTASATAATACFTMC